LFLQFPSHNSPRINTSKIFSIFRISLIPKDINPTRINTSENKHLKPPIINTSGHKDLKSCRINTSKKHGRGRGAALKYHLNIAASHPNSECEAAYKRNAGTPGAVMKSVVPPTAPPSPAGASAGL
jgi:hypothetical protein